MAEKLALILKLVENPRKTSIFNILDENNKLRPEISELIAAGILKYFNAPTTNIWIKLEDHNENIKLIVSGEVVYDHGKEF